MSLDITARKQAEEARQRTESRLRLANERFELASAAVDCLIYDWNVEQDTVERTEGLTRILGYSLEEADATGAWLLDLIHPDDRRRVQEEAEAAWEAGDRYAIEYRIRRKDGQYIYVLDQGIVVLRNQGRRPVRQVGSITDISDRKRAEEERERLLRCERAARAEAEAANRIKDEFLAILSHELKSPLNAIVGWSKILRSHQLDQKTTERALDTIERNAQLQTRLIEELLDISHIMQGRLSLNRSLVNPASPIHKAIETVGLAIEAKNIQLATFIHPNVGILSGILLVFNRSYGISCQMRLSSHPQAGR